jgi:hypothetical protein
MLLQLKKLKGYIKLICYKLRKYFPLVYSSDKFVYFDIVVVLVANDIFDNLHLSPSFFINYIKFLFIQ